MACHLILFRSFDSIVTVPNGEDPTPSAPQRMFLGAKAELKMNRAASERLEGVLVAVRQGAIGLKQRLDPFKDLLTYEEQVELPQTGIEALDVLLECEAKLLKMLQRNGK